MRIEADTLQDAMIKAGKELGCSVLDLEIEVIRQASSGILGFFKKTAIIEAKIPQKAKPEPKKKNQKEQVQIKEPNLAKESKQAALEPQEKPKKPEPKVIVQEQKPKEPRAKKVKEQVNFDEILPQIRDGVEKIFKSTCFDIDQFEVSRFDKDTVYIKVDGKDAALIIGKDGCRYKAFSYILFSWINLKYGLMVRFEVSEFLKNQENMMNAYLSDIIVRVEKDGKAVTKPLDGVLIKIALEKLRSKFPNKFVGVKNGKNGKFVVINDFK